MGIPMVSAASSSAASASSSSSSSSLSLSLSASSSSLSSSSYYDRVREQVKISVTRWCARRVGNGSPASPNRACFGIRW
jgi:hypothetical protein